MSGSLQTPSSTLDGPTSATFRSARDGKRWSWRTRGAALVFAVLVAAFASEVALRFAGFRPWSPPEGLIVDVTGGRLCQPDPALGWKRLPGQYTVTLRDGFQYIVTHDDDSLRVTAPPASATSVSDDVTPGEARAASPRPEIWVFGASHTYGDSLNDAESYPWLLQTWMPHYRVVNFAVPGYGTVHAVLQLREALQARHAPRAVVLVYGLFHDERNAFLRSRQKTATQDRIWPLRHPRAWLDDSGKLQIATDEPRFVEFPLMRRSALVSLIEERYDQCEPWLRDAHRVSLALIDEFARLATEHDARILVACESHDQASTDQLAEFCASRGLAFSDISVPLHTPANWHAPVDPAHPSALGALRIGMKLEAALKLGLLLDDYQSLARDKPDDFEGHEALGRAAWQQGDLATAERELGVAHRLAPRQAGAAFHWGRWRFEQGRLADAIEPLQTVLAEQPQHLDAQAMLAAALAATGEEASAIERYQAALKLDSRWAVGFNNLATLLAAAGRRDEARAALRQALSVDPKLSAATEQLKLLSTDRDH